MRAYDEQSLILLRRDASGGGRGLAERQKTAKCEPERREAVVNIGIDQRHLSTFELALSSVAHKTSGCAAS